VPLRRTLRLALCALALAAATPAPHARADVDPAWFPLRAGATWIYSAHRDRTLEPAGNPLMRGLHVGRTEIAAEPAPERGPGAFLLRETTVLQPAEGVGEKERSTAWAVYALGRELRMLAASESQADGAEGEAVYDPPLRILAGTTVGEKWKAGTLRNGGQRTEVTGEVLGVEDLSGEPGWKGALKVRLAGDVTGTAGAADPPAEIAKGRYERLLWFVRDVGVVRDVTTLTLDMRLPNDHTVATVDVLTLRLLEHRGLE
jgi:hypothetical protein